MLDTAQRLLSDLRQSALDSYGDLERPYDPGLQDLIGFAAEVCDTPIALVSIVSTDRQHFMAELGFGRSSTSIEESFCAHAILQDGHFEIENASTDARFQSNPLVIGPDAVRFYSGVPIKDPQGVPLGTICVIDKKPRSLSPLQRRTLALLASQAEWRIQAIQNIQLLREERIARSRAALERERLILDLENERARFRALLDSSPSFAALLCGEDLVFEYANESHKRLIGGREVVGKPLRTALPEAKNIGLSDVAKNVFQFGLPFRSPLLELDLSTGTRYVDISIQPYFDATDGVAGVFVQGIDISERVEAERLLATQRA